MTVIDCGDDSKIINCSKGKLSTEVMPGQYFFQKMKILRKSLQPCYILFIKQKKIWVIKCIWLFIYKEQHK